MAVTILFVASVGISAHSFVAELVTIARETRVGFCDLNLLLTTITSEHKRRQTVGAL